MVLLFSMVLFSCKDGRINGPQNSFKKELAKASPDFRDGWNDGCETGRASVDNDYYRMFIKNNKIDGWRIASSEDYQVAWNYGFWYCYRDDYVDQKTPSFRSFFGGFQ